MKKAEIHTKKEAERDLFHEAFLSERRITNQETVYMPLGELYGVKILVKYKVKKSGTYLILE